MTFLPFDELHKNYNQVLALPMFSSLNETLSCALSEVRPIIEVNTALNWYRLAIIQLFSTLT